MKKILVLGFVVALLWTGGAEATRHVPVWQQTEDASWAQVTSEVTREKAVWESLIPFDPATLHSRVGTIYEDTGCVSGLVIRDFPVKMRLSTCSGYPRLSLRTMRGYAGDPVVVTSEFASDVP